MGSDFIKGVKTGLVIYGVGTLITVIVHLIVGWDYAHAPPPSFMAILLTLTIGGFRFIYTLHITMTYRSQKAKGKLVVHSVVALIVIGFILWAKYQYQ